MSLEEVKEAFKHIKGSHRSKLYPYDPFRKVVDYVTLECLALSTDEMYEVFEEMIEEGDHLSKAELRKMYKKYVEIEGRIIDMYLNDIKNEITFVLPDSKKRYVALKDLNSELQRFLYLYKQVMDWIIDEITEEKRTEEICLTERLQI